MKRQPASIRLFGILLIVTMLLAAQPAPAIQAQTNGGTIYLPIVVHTFPRQFGVATDQLNPSDGIDLAMAAGSGWARLNLPWDAIQPDNSSQFNWNAVAYTESQLKIAAANQLETILVVGTTPRWAADPTEPNISCDILGKVDKNQYQKLAEFLRQVVWRYSQPPFNVRYFELWNEPDVSTWLGCWGSHQLEYFGGRDYGEMLAAAYPAMKSANPAAQVLIGGLLMDQDPEKHPFRQGDDKIASHTIFFEGIMQSAGRDAFDGVSFHAYDYYKGPNLYYNEKWLDIPAETALTTVQLAKAAYLRQRMAAAGVTGKYLINTEVSLLGETESTAPNSSFEVTKAYYVPQALSAALFDGYRMAMWYTLVERGGKIYRNSGLVTPSLTPQPAYYAFQYTTRELYGAVPRHKLRDEFGRADIDGYAFSLPDGRTLRVVWATGANSTLDLRHTPANLVRIAYNGQPFPIPPSREVQVNAAPLFIYD